jgi:hypothetical protein
MVETMEHPIYRVIAFKIVGPFTLEVSFDDGTSQVINFQSILAGHYFGPLRDQKLFEQVDIDPEVHTLVWPNGADFDPLTLHNWPEYVDELIALTKSWKERESASVHT